MYRSSSYHPVSLSGRKVLQVAGLALILFLLLVISSTSTYFDSSLPVRHISHHPFSTKDKIEKENDASTQVDSVSIQQDSSEQFSSISLPLEGFPSCESWLIAKDGPSTGVLGRDFELEPVRILETGYKPWFIAQEHVLAQCDVNCRQIKPGSPESANYTFWDAHTAELPRSVRQPSQNQVNKTDNLGPLVVRNNESPAYYPGLSLPMPGADVSMLISLSSHVPQPGLPPEDDYFEKPLAFEEKIPAVMAMISNCDPLSFRNGAIRKMRELGLEVHQYGNCGRTHEGAEETNGRSKKQVKHDLIRKYMFFAAFENSIYEDYVSEKLFDALVAGSVPIYIGAPNVMDFVPDQNAIIHLPSLEAVPKVVKVIKYLMSNQTAYEEKLAWKQGVTRAEFRALLNSQAVSQPCKLCIEIATRIQEQESLSADLSRPCSCITPATPDTPDSGREIHHLYVRERGTLRFYDVFVGAHQLSISAVHVAILEAFRRAGHVPTWKRFGYQTYQKQDVPYRVYKLTPVRTVYREAVFGSASLETDESFKFYLVRYPCPKLEVILM